VGLWILIFTRQSWSKRILHVACLFVCSILILIPWSVRNWQVYGKFTPGRVCLSETRHFDHAESVFRYKDYYMVDVFPGKQVRFELESTQETLLFHYYLDDKYLGTLQPLETLNIQARAYFGRVIRGGNPIHLPRASFQTIDSNDVIIQSSDFNGDFLISPGIQFDSSGIFIPQSAESWQFKIISTWADSVKGMEVLLPTPIDPHDMHRFAFLIGLDAPSLEANGYMVWMHPWLEADLWRFKQGEPKTDIQWRDIGRIQNPMTLSRLIAQEPVRFFTQHFFVEFFNFWSPKIRKIKTEANVSPYMNGISLIFYTPVLVFFILSLFLYRKQGPTRLLLLIPIANLSLFYSFFFTQMRYRLPVDGFLILFASIGLTTLWNQIKKATQSRQYRLQRKTKLNLKSDRIDL
jgi:hypothetical protein